MMMKKYKKKQNYKKKKKMMMKKEKKKRTYKKKKSRRSSEIELRSPEGLPFRFPGFWKFIKQMKEKPPDHEVRVLQEALTTRRHGKRRQITVVTLICTSPREDPTINTRDTGISLVMQLF